MSHLEVDGEIIWETDYINLTVSCNGEVHHFETVEEMDRWVQENLQTEE